MVVVIGSTNIDTLISVGRFPVDGETVRASSVRRVLGGKGANQAISVSRLGSKCLFVTALGKDAGGQMAQRTLEGEDIALEIQHSEFPTGEAFVEVEDGGRNRIIVNAGANEELSIPFIEALSEKILGASVLLLQGEIPCEANAFIVDRFSSSVPIIVDPAPPQENMMEYVQRVAFFTPNETEFEELSGFRISGSVDDIVFKVEKFQKSIGTNLILKMGSRGCCLVTEEETMHITAFSQGKVLDTTGAGDAFNGAFSHALDIGKNLQDALRMAVAASGICVTRIGAASSLPYAGETLSAIESMGDDATGRRNNTSQRVIRYYRKQLQ